MSGLLWQACVSGILIGGVYALVALGLTLIFGVMRIINFAHGTLMMLGMYATFFLYTLWGVDPYLSVLLVGPAFFLVGMALQRGVIEPNIAAPESSQLLLTLGVALFLENAALVAFSPDYRSLRLPYGACALLLGDAVVNVPRLTTSSRPSPHGRRGAVRGHLEGKRVIAAETMVARIRAACEARRDPDLVVIARTDARAVLGLPEALRRAHAAGADVLFVEAPVGEAEVEAVAHALAGVPLLINLGGGGKTPMLPAARLEALGFRIAIYPGDLQKAAIHAMRDVAAALAREGTTASLASRMVTFEERFEVVGLSRFRALEQRYRAP